LFLLFKSKGKGDTPDFAGLPDEELVRLFAEEASERAMEEIFNRYSHLVYGVCRNLVKDSEVARDLVLTVFEKLLRSLAESNVRNLKSWVLVVARNECYLHFRKAKHKMVSIDDQANGHASFPGLTDDGGGEDHEEKERLLTRVVDGLEKLKMEQNVCLNLLYLQGKSYQEICETTGFTFGQVKSHVQNGKRNLKLMLEDETDE